MLNRHAIVLFLGVAGIVLLSAAATISAPVHPAGALGVGFVLLVVGLFLDQGNVSLRSVLSRVVQGAACVSLLFAALGHLRSSTTVPLGLAELGILLAVLGLLSELCLNFRWLRSAIAIQAAGDALFIGAAVLAASVRNAVPSKIGWIFIALVGTLSLYAAGSNLILQIARLRRVSAGWRFSVAQFEPSLSLKTPKGNIELPRSMIEDAIAISSRQLLVVLSSSIPEAFLRNGLPLEELVSGTTELDAPKAQRFGLIFHEQELGVPVLEAREKIRNPEQEGFAKRRESTAASARA